MKVIIKQTKTQSLTETLINVFIGYVIAIASQVLIFPLFGITTSFENNLKIGAVFTLISIIRSYSVRRFFNWQHAKAAMAENRIIVHAFTKTNKGEKIEVGDIVYLNKDDQVSKTPDKEVF